MKVVSPRRAWVFLAPAVAALLLGLSCTRMPIAPRVPVLVEGIISGPSGDPVPGVAVSFISDDEVWLGARFADTDSLGHYSVEVASGKYWANVYPPYYLRTIDHSARVAFSPSEHRYDFRFTGFRVTGQVTGPTGGPIDSGAVSVEASDYRGAESPLSGSTYSFLLPAGTYSFLARDANGYSGFPSRHLPGVSIASDTTIDISLDGVPVSGIVTGPNGMVMEGVAVRADYASQKMTGADGSYRLYVPPGTYRLQFQPPYPYYIFPRVTNPITIGGPTTINGDLSGIEWKGTVRRVGTGDPVPDVSVRVEHVADPDFRRAFINSGTLGEFRFILEPNLRYDVSVYDPVAGKRTWILTGISATADSTFDIFIP